MRSEKVIRRKFYFWSVTCDEECTEMLVIQSFSFISKFIRWTSFHKFTIKTTMIAQFIFTTHEIRNGQRKNLLFTTSRLVMNVHIAISRDKNDIKPKNKKYFFSHVFTHIPVECWVTIWESGTISIFFCTKKKNVWEKKKINWKNIWDWKTCAMFSFIFETLWRLLFFCVYMKFLWAIT